MTDSELMVSEVFGLTIQGEGPFAGNPAIFLRLAGCNLSCTWCDTPYSWDWARFDRSTEVSRRSPQSLANEIAPQLNDGGAMLVITGGEPLLQARRLSEFVNMLHASCGYTPTIQVETNGTRLGAIGDDDEIDYVVSPKLTNARTRDIEVPYWWWIDRGANFKYVCETVADVAVVDRLVHDHSLPRERVWIMPQGRSAAELTETAAALIPAVVERGFRYTDRLHIRLWGDERGR